MTSLSIVVWLLALWTSTIGVSPLTVTVSDTAPTLRSASTRARERSGQLDAFTLRPR